MNWIDERTSWKKFFKKKEKEEYFRELFPFVAQAYENKTCYPPQELIFNAFDLCPLEDIKVVILGQDPYHGPGQANGLSFSVNEGVKFPPSLVNIFKELGSDIGIPYPISGNLEAWAKQGVFLLNAVLTVEASKAGSHARKGWEKFTDEVIAHISNENSGVVFLLWGSYAHKKEKLIDASKHKILKTGHPSPLSANRGYWFGNKSFSKTNTYLKSQNKKPIDWSLKTDDQLKLKI